ncbi:MAG: 4Fe-4S dicluster domain-containing protein [Desulfobacteraceae bacterium]|nr:MAG: 4Fe-4S dicluster domain-containing protein [Desulfobacteraceae bacterium]
MIKKSFFGLLKPRLEYDIIDAKTPAPREITASKTIQLFSHTVFDKKDKILFQVGDKVKAGQKISIMKGSDDYIISSVSGTIASISPYAGNFGMQMTSVVIKKDDRQESDTQFAEAAKTPSFQVTTDFLAHLPGAFPVSILSQTDPKVTKLVISGMDTDLLVQTRQQIVKTSASSIKKGIRILKDITNLDTFIIVVPEALSQDAISTGATVKTVPPAYPSASPHLVLKDILGKELPAGDPFEKHGIAVVSAEALAALGNAYEKKEIPTRKILTVIDKIGTKKLISAQIGTPFKDIFSALNIRPEDGDRIIIGGPMTGLSAYTEDHPVCPDTDAVIIQDRSVIPYVSNSACINCGECIRICPAKVQVSMLVRFLEAGQYDNAADNYDLFSCIECGLCSYVCTAKIPIFQYIRLAKFELARIQSAEAENV